MEPRTPRFDSLEIAQQIIDEYEPGHTVASWKEVEGTANVVELKFTDGTKRKLVGLFAWYIINRRTSLEFPPR